MTRATILIATLSMFALIACAEGRTPAPDTVASNPDTAWTATPTGLGRMHAGMTVARARAEFPGELAALDSTAAGCTHATVAGVPGNVRAMVVDGVIARFEVNDAAVPTARGVRVGDPESRVDSLYAGRLTREPHKYTDGSYLVVRAEAPADSNYRLIFETDTGRVTKYRMGQLPEVAWVEGCS